MTDNGVAVIEEPSGRQAVGPCRLYLVRHGTTTLNVENRYRGRRDVPLDAQGYQDAVDAARRLSNVGLNAVYTGPLRRTIANCTDRRRRGACAGPAHPSRAQQRGLRRMGGDVGGGGGDV